MIRQRPIEDEFDSEDLFSNDVTDSNKEGSEDLEALERAYIGKPTLLGRTALKFLSRLTK